jgi:hypothetical protein
MEKTVNFIKTAKRLIVVADDPSLTGAARERADDNARLARRYLNIRRPARSPSPPIGPNLADAIAATPSPSLARSNVSRPSRSRSGAPDPCRRRHVNHAAPRSSATDLVRLSVRQSLSARIAA